MPTFPFKLPSASLDYYGYICFPSKSNIFLNFLKMHGELISMMKPEVTRAT